MARKRVAVDTRVATGKYRTKKILTSQIKLRVARGVSVRQIAKETEVSQETVRRTIAALEKEQQAEQPAPPPKFSDKLLQRKWV